MKSAVKPYQLMGRRLKTLCRKKSISQSQLQDKLSRYGDDYYVSIDAIKKWYSGQTAPTYTRLCALCEILDCSADYLLGRIYESNHDFEYIEKETGLSEDVLKLMKCNRNTIRNIEYILSTEISRFQSKGSLYNFCSVLTLIVSYINCENDDEKYDEDKSILIMLQLQKQLHYLQNHVRNTRKKSNSRHYKKWNRKV